MMLSKKWCKALAALAVLALVRVPARAQRCSTEVGDITEVSNQLSKAAQPRIILDIAARYGDAVVPALRRVAKPDRPIESSEGAAQAALAKLGDKTALEQLRQELDGTAIREKRGAIRKLGFAGTPEAISVLVTFLLTDDCKHCEQLGDTGYDPRIFVHQTLTMVLPNPPIARRTFEDFLDLAAWQAWWKSNKGHITVIEPHTQLSDPELRCQATRAEWYDAEAVARLAEEGGTSVMPVLRDLALLGYKDELGNFNSVRGAARTALAMLGDRSEFDAIVQELKSSDYVDALFKLRYIGSRRAVDEITANIGETAFMTKDGLVPYNYQAQLKRHRNEFLTVLSQMVRNGPLIHMDSYADQDVELWKAWWLKNREHAELAVTRPAP